MRRVKGLSKESKERLWDTDKSTVTARGKEGWQQVEEGKRKINGDGRRLDFGW